ncbi:MAG: hypothetical protein RDU13_10685 [Elusimicrobiales bacterium]|nr:hypothetical protein [Elusimicrobiales bacterium]
MTPSALKQALEYLGKLSECETAVADFYERCAARWPEEEVWGALVPQEREHARLVCRMAELLASAPQDFEASRPLSPLALKTFIDAAFTYARRVALGEADKAAALSLSLDIEKSIIESKYETLFNTADKEYKDLVSRLVSDTAAHRELLQARVNQIKFRK